MVTLLAWCFGDALDPSLARALAQGYAAVRPLPEPEAARLHAEGTFAALRFAITRITDFELRPRGVGVYKDYRRFLARADALDALGSEGLRAMLGV
jgi:homoserine kinase type II